MASRALPFEGLEPTQAEAPFPHGSDAWLVANGRVIYVNTHLLRHAQKDCTVAQQRGSWTKALGAPPRDTKTAATWRRHALLAIAFPRRPWCVTAIEAGSLGWLSLLALQCAWNSIKLTFNEPITVVLLIRARIRAIAARRRAGEAEYGASQLSDTRDPMTPLWSSQAG